MSIQWQKSHKLYKIAKNDCWSDDDISSGNDVDNQPSEMEIPYQLRGHSALQYVKGKAPNFDLVSLLKGENGLEQIIICKVIDEPYKKFRVDNIGSLWSWSNSLHC